MRAAELSPADAPPQAAPRLRAPLLWVLVPFAAGLWLGWHWRLPALPLALGGTGFALLALALCPSGDAPTRAGRLWPVALLTAVCLLGWSYGIHRFVPRLDDWQSLPPREATLVLRIERVFSQDKYGRWNGIARISEAPELLPELVGQGVQFRLKAGQPPRTGALVSASGIIRPLPPPDNSRSFAAYLAKREVTFELRQGAIRETLSPPPLWRRGSVAGRAWLTKALLKGSDQHNELRAILPAMLLGERQLLAPAQRDLFKGTGMMHLFAVSGLHVGLLSLVIAQGLALLRLGDRARAVTGLLMLLLYVLLIGASPSALRAFLMVLFFWGSRAFLRQGGGVAALTASALAVLLWQPVQLFDAGAQLSYGIVAGILLYGVPLAHLLRSRVTLYRYLPEASLTLRQRWIKGGSERLAEYSGASLGAFLVALPLSLHFFGVLAPGAFFLNMLLVPLTFLAVCGGVLASACALLAQLPVVQLLAAPLWRVFNHAAWLCTAGMQWLIDSFSHVRWLFMDHPLAADWPVPLLLGGLAILVLTLQADRFRHSLRWQLLPLGTMSLGLLCIMAAG